VQACGEEGFSQGSRTALRLQIFKSPEEMPILYRTAVSGGDVGGGGYGVESREVRVRVDWEDRAGDRLLLDAAGGSDLTWGRI